MIRAGETSPSISPPRTPRLATSYRWRVRIVGVETAWRLAKTTREPWAIIEPPQPGQTLEIVVQAVNGSQQGVASELVLYAAQLRTGLALQNGA